VRAGVDRLVIANRTPDRAARLVELLETQRAGVATAAGLDQSLADELQRAELIINTTSVGMHPDAAAQPLELPALAAGAWVVDIIYNPLETRLLAAARAQGARCLNGVDMLVHQGALALARWTGCEPPIAVMREVLVRELERRAAAH
ncbi:MAG: shikimate dehydrogenase, partial [Armatimonadetes bacterium]|nr:shikimate dehydrogenase [Armatimonadota bacterium]